MCSIWRTIPSVDVRDAAALGCAMVVVGAAFGALAASAHLSLMLTVSMSVFVFAGGSQFLAVAVVAAGGAPVAAVLGGLLINLRHIPFGFAVGDVVGRSWAARLLGAHLMVDEVVASTRRRPDPRRARSTYWLTGALMFLGWNVGTLVGALAEVGMPDPGRLGIDAAFPAALLALLLPGLRTPAAARVGSLGGLLAVLVTPWAPAGLPVLMGLGGLLVAGRADDRPAGRR